MSADRPIGGILGHLGPHLTLVTCNLSPTAGIRSKLQTSLRPGASTKGPSALTLQPTQAHRHDLSRNLQ
jgi:hypothetical protein